MVAPERAVAGFPSITIVLMLLEVFSSAQSRLAAIQFI
jgi:hypothetical protein